MFVIIEAPFGGQQKVESADSKRRSNSDQQKIKPYYDDNTTKDLNVDQMAPTPPD